MKLKTAIICTFLLAGDLCLAAGSASSASEALLTFPNQVPSPVMVDFGGVKYRFLLSPDYDVAKHVVVLQVVMQKSSVNVDDTNLLDVTGKLHGAQPYIFNASDFVNGIQASAYGAERIVNLPKRHISARMTIRNVDVSSFPADTPQHPGCEFRNLIIEIALKPLA